MLIVILVHNDSLFVLLQVHRARLLILSSGRHCCLQQKEQWRQTLKLSHMLIVMYHHLSLLVLCVVWLSLSQSALSLCHCLCSSVTELVAQLVGQSVCLSVTSLFTNCASLSGLALACILRRSLGPPATTFRRSLGSFKGSSLINSNMKWQLCRIILLCTYDVLCHFYNSVLGSVLLDNVTFSSTLSMFQVCLFMIAVKDLFKGPFS